MARTNTHECSNAGGAPQAGRLLARYRACPRMDSWPPSWMEMGGDEVRRFLDVVGASKGGKEQAQARARALALETLYRDIQRLLDQVHEAMRVRHYAAHRGKLCQLDQMLYPVRRSAGIILPSPRYSGERGWG